MAWMGGSSAVVRRYASYMNTLGSIPGSGQFFRKARIPLNTPGSSLGGGLKRVQRGSVVCPLRERESLSVTGIRTEDITRGVWTPDRLTEVDPDDALAPPLP
jgi:hypothetical protein